MKKYLLQLIIIFTSLVVLFWIMKANIFKTNDQIVRFEITDFNSDKLHIESQLKYTVNYGSAVQCKPGVGYGPYCACLRKSDPDTNVYSAYHFYNCYPEKKKNRMKKKCPIFIEGYCDNGIFKTGIEKYDLPNENQKQLLVTTSVKSEIEIYLEDNGRASVKDIYVDGQLLSGQVASQLQKQ